MYRTKAEAEQEAKQWQGTLEMVAVRVHPAGSWEAGMYGAWAAEPKCIVDRRARKKNVEVRRGL